MVLNATITLIENSTAGRPPAVFVGQAVEVIHEADVVLIGVDGITSTGNQPSKVVWRSGTAANLSGITDVKIVTIDGKTLIDGELNIFSGAPNDIEGGVEFSVLRRQ